MGPDNKIGSLEFSIVVFLIVGLLVVAGFHFFSEDAIGLVEGLEDFGEGKMEEVTDFKYPVLRQELAEAGTLGQERDISIESCDELYSSIGNQAEGNFYLENDLDCLPEDEEITDSFGGILDGRGYKIENMNSPLFGTNSGEIKNLRLNGIIVDEGGTTGAVARENSGIIENTTVSGEIHGGSNVGGLVGTNSGEITASASVAHANGTGSNVGGLTGSNSGTVNNSYATGYAGGEDTVGGLIGSNTGTVKNTYAATRVVSEGSRGGLTGSGSAENSFWSTDAAGISPEEDNGGGTPKTDDLMESKIIYTDPLTSGLEEPWDFEKIWTMG